MRAYAPTMTDIVIATSNPHKVEELGAILAAEGLTKFRLLTLKDVAPNGLPEPAETGSTFIENATIKASTYARLTGRLCLADDSGIEIDALHGRPGVISSHYATDGRETGVTRQDRDNANNARVLRELESVPLERRAARFRCVMVLSEPVRGVLHIADGACEGRIGVPPDVPRGVGGFGYDPLFLLAPDFRHTTSELGAEAKNAISHRGIAARKLAAFLRTLS